MGLFTNKKKPCPVCGNATPRLFPDTVEGLPICKECAGKKDMPAIVWETMTVEKFRQYIAFHQENQPLRDQFEKTHDWCSVIYLDIPKKLFRLSYDGLVMEASCLKSFRILEGDNPLFESSRKGLRCYETDIPDRVRAAAPVIAQFEIQYEQYRQMERMKEEMEKNGDEKNLPYISEPKFSYPIIQKGLGLELTLEHPYWGGTHVWYGSHPMFDDTYPSIDTFLYDFEKETKKLHNLAVNLMNFLGFGAMEIRIPRNMSVGGPKIMPIIPTAPVDPVAEIQKYKALFDSGAITEEEFTAKKRQLMGI